MRKGQLSRRILSPFILSVFLNAVEQFVFDKDCDVKNVPYETGDIVIFLKLLMVLNADDIDRMTENNKDMQT